MVFLCPGVRALCRSHRTFSRHVNTASRGVARQHKLLAKTNRVRFQYIRLHLNMFGLNDLFLSCFLLLIWPKMSWFFDTGVRKVLIATNSLLLGGKVPHEHAVRARNWRNHLGRAHIVLRHEATWKHTLSGPVFFFGEGRQYTLSQHRKSFCRCSCGALYTRHATGCSHGGDSSLVPSVVVVVTRRPHHFFVLNLRQQSTLTSLVGVAFSRSEWCVCWRCLFVRCRLSDTVK